jgi:hypothetical protein
MVDWEVTAKTIFCDHVNDEVTIIISGNGAAKCSGFQKYGNPTKEITKDLKTRSRTAGKELKCLGADCHIVKQQRDQLMDLK